MGLAKWEGYGLSVQEGEALYGVRVSKCLENPMRCFRSKQRKKLLIFSLQRELGPGRKQGIK